LSNPSTPPPPISIIYASSVGEHQCLEKINQWDEKKINQWDETENFKLQRGYKYRFSNQLRIPVPLLYSQMNFMNHP